MNRPKMFKVFHILCFLFGAVIIQVEGQTCGHPDVSKLQVDYIGKTSDGRYLFTSLINEGLSREDAMKFCQINYFMPLIDDSPEIGLMVYDYLIGVTNSTINDRPFWLSLNDLENMGDFKWHKDIPLGSYRNWGEGGTPIPSPDWRCVATFLNSQTRSTFWINLACSSVCWRPLCQW